MSDLERDLKEAMERLSRDASMPPDAGAHVVGRARRRRIVVPIVASAVVVVLGGGIVAGANSLWDENSSPAPASSPSEDDSDNPGPYRLGDDPSTARVEIATGERNEQVWTLYANGGDGNLCIGNDWGGGGGKGCGPRPNEHDINMGGSIGDGPEWLIDGDVSYEVAAVEVRLEGQAPFRVPVFPDPTGFGVDFFLFFVPENPEGEVVALAEDGSVLESASLTEMTQRHNELADIDEPEISDADACIAEKATIVGTPGDDVLDGTPGHDVIKGLEGHDVITGLGGGDVVCGGGGDDEIDTGDGDDEIWGGPGADSMDAGPGFDTAAYWEAAGGVTVDLAAGTATGEGNDSLSGFEALGGSRHDDLLRGTDAGDQIEANDGNDQVFGLGGDDILYPGAGDDEIEGGEGMDFFGFLTIENPVTVNLGSGTSEGDGNDILKSIEVVHGSEFDDVLIGSDADESISGLEGNDTIDGGGGDDELWGEYPRLTADQYRRDYPFIEFKDDDIDGGPGDDRIGGGPGDNECTNGEMVEDC
ncbi:MAG: calcium-binding protein [Actinomycetota bacterium]